MRNSDFGRVVMLSERAAWSLDQVFPAGATLDLGKWFMPKVMFAGKNLDFLDEDEKRTLNQIYGNAYAYLFYFVEAYIIDMAMKCAQAELYGDDDNLRAMLRFADEEVKHQQMFLRFGEMFKSAFRSEVEVIPDPQALASFVFSKSPMAVMLLTLHMELMTQSHFVSCMRDNKEMDPQFTSLFRYHWMEESQHAKLDALELRKLLVDASPETMQQAIDDYIAIVEFIAVALGEQAKLDIVSLERAVGRTFPAEQRDAIEAAQRSAYHRAFLHSGMTNAAFLEFVAEYFPTAVSVMAQAAEKFQ